jgi:hypothetical protein
MIDDEVRHRAGLHASLLAKAVVPLFGIDPREKALRLQGSATLVAVRGGDAFLFTAGHVIDNFGDRSPMLTWISTPTPLLLAGEGFTSEPKLERTKDHIDLAFLKLSTRTVEALAAAGAEFADAAWMSLDSGPSDVYAVIGYPLSINDPDFERTEEHQRVTVLNAEPRLTWGTSCDQAAYQRVKRSAFHNVVVQRQPPRAKDGRPRQPTEGMKNAQGMSGGAIFNLGPETELRRSVATMRLAGILTEYHAKTHRFIGANARMMSGIFRRGRV